MKMSFLTKFLLIKIFMKMTAVGMQIMMIETWFNNRKKPQEYWSFKNKWMNEDIFQINIQIAIAYLKKILSSSLEMQETMSTRESLKLITVW